MQVLAHDFVDVFAIDVGVPHLFGINDHHRPGKARVNMAGCLDRCEEGPVMVVYPEEIWYTYVDREDIDEIVSEHLQNGRVVERLKI